MQIDKQQFMTDGYLIIRDCIPPQQLEPLRQCFATLVERQCAVWKSERQADDPPGGLWETAPQPRLWFDTVVDEATADAVEFCLHPNTLGVSRQLLCAPEAAILAMFLMCSPVRDHGPAKWHRDLHPFDQAPLSGLQADISENAPGLVQWNIPLYDDDVLWVVPGSHIRLNTAAENQQLMADPKVPLPGSIPVELKAGDGVVYINTILHWGSNYSAKLRRTIHMGYRGFGGPLYPYVPHFYWDLGFTKQLPPAIRETFEHFEHLLEDECQHVVALFKAIIAKNTDAFHTELAVIHPGANGRIVCLMLLSKLAYKMAFEAEDFGFDLMRYKQIAQHFSAAELKSLWQRFTPLDAKLRTDTEQLVPGFQHGPMLYHFEEMPAAFDVEEFIASWDD